MDFPIQSGLKCQRKVEILPGADEWEHGGVQCCSAYKETISKNLSELLFPFLLQFKSIFCKVLQRATGNSDTSQQPLCYKKQMTTENLLSKSS